ncbi:MAG: phosphatase PAP2 family protein [Adhaeribacter sp.]
MLPIPALFLSQRLKTLWRHPAMKRLRARYPRSYAFIRQRFDPRVFWGLPLSILLVLVSVNLAMFTELAEEAVNSNEMKNLDMAVTGWFFNQRHPLLSQLVYHFTNLGSNYGIAILTTLAGLVLLWKRKAYYVLALVVSVVGSGLSSRLTKLYFQRERPLNFSYYDPESTFSFPSGHATSAMALMGILCYILFLETKTLKARLLTILAAGVYIALMGLSRIYLGMHFLTDIAAGFILGFLWVVLAIGLMEYFAHRKLQKEKKEKV